MVHLKQGWFIALVRLKQEWFVAMVRLKQELFIAMVRLKQESMITMVTESVSNTNPFAFVTGFTEVNRFSGFCLPKSKQHR